MRIILAPSPPNTHIHTNTNTYKQTITTNHTFEHKRTTSTPSHRTTNPFSWKRTNVSKLNLNQNGNASWCIFIFLPSVLCYHHLTHPVLTKQKKKNNMPNQTCSKNNNSNLKQPRFLVHIHIVPRLWWWYFFSISTCLSCDRGDDCCPGAVWASSRL